MKGKWVSYTKNYTLSDLGPNAPEWAIEQRSRQAEQIRDLRVARDRRANELVRGFAAGLAGPGPWAFPDLYSRWREVCGEMPNWNVSYKSRWFVDALKACGFQIVGECRGPVLWVRMDDGLKRRRRGPKVDNRMVHRNM